MTSDARRAAHRLTAQLLDARSRDELPIRWAARCLDAAADIDGPDLPARAARLLGLVAEHYLFVADKTHAAAMFDALGSGVDDVLSLLRQACADNWPPVHAGVTGAACDAVEALLGRPAALLSA